MKEKISISLTGHRPKDLFGYDIHSSDYDSIRNRLAFILKSFINRYEFVECHSGMALGADMIWAEIIVAAKQKWPNRVTFIADIPNPFQSSKWTNNKAIELYNKLLESSDEKIFYEDEYTPWCMQKRNIGMLDASEILIAVWNRELKPNSGTSNAIKHAIKTNKNIFVVHPSSDVIYKDKPNDTLIKTTNAFSHEELEQKEKDILNSLFNLGFSIDKQDDSGNTLLSHAIRSPIKIERFTELTQNKKEYTSIKVYSKQQDIKNVDFYLNLGNFTFKPH